MSQADSPPFEAETWAMDLRDQLVEDGYSRPRVDQVLTGTLARFRSARVRSFVPILVERSVRDALRDN